MSAAHVTASLTDVSGTETHQHSPPRFQIKSILVTVPTKTAATPQCAHRGSKSQFPWFELNTAPRGRLRYCRWRRRAVDSWFYCPWQHRASGAADRGASGCPLVTTASWVVQVLPGERRRRRLRPLRRHRSDGRGQPVAEGVLPCRGGPREAPGAAVPVEAQRRLFPPL